MVFIVVDDDLARQGARASAPMVLIVLLSWNIRVLALGIGLGDNFFQAFTFTL